VAVVQYTFTHKQYTEQHDETEYTEGNVITISLLKLTKMKNVTKGKRPLYSGMRIMVDYTQIKQDMDHWQI
jgi:SepF-like predicted cell division protein (DUF552 family)